MKTKTILLGGFGLWALTAAAQAAAPARAADVCPTLPAGSTLRWTLQPGPDFDVCYAAPPGRATTIGVYLGRYPSFHPDAAAALGPGVVAGKPVTWYRKDAEATFGSSARQTLVNVNPAGGAVAHVWIYSNNAAELESDLAALAKMSFRR